jgi:hypothetical protein
MHLLVSLPYRISVMRGRGLFKTKNTYFVFSNFFFFENLAVCEMWENTVEPGRAIDDNMTRALCTQ